MGFAARAVIRIMLIEGHSLVTEGLRSALAREPDMDLVATSGTLAEAMDTLHTSRPDVVIVDTRLPDGSGLELVRRFRSSDTAPAFLVLSSVDSAEYADAALQLRAAGFVTTAAPTDDLVSAVRRVAAGGIAFDEPVMRRAALADWQPLSERERGIVAGVLRGMSNDEIASQLKISRKTVEAYLSKLFQRFRVGSRTDLALRAERERWLDLPPAERRRQQ